LPHAHILLWLYPRDKLEFAEAINYVICAELPDPVRFPKLYATLTNFMIHGPCGFARPHSTCMKDRRCSKFYPKKFVGRATFDVAGYLVYRRRDMGVTVVKNDVVLDNRSIVPYNPKLIMKYQSHVKYLFKYIIKGVDRVTVALQQGDDECVDEIQQYYNCRYLSPSESIWRIFAFPIHSRWPSIQRLTFHMPGDQRVVFNDNSDFGVVLDRNRSKKTMFLAWMDANKEYSMGRSLTYIQFPSMFTYDAKLRRWQPRQQGQFVGRLTFIP